MNRVLEPGREGRLVSGTELPLSERPDILFRAIEAAAEVRRRYQFFEWAQGYLQALIRNQLVVCGSYQRTRRDLVFEVFNSITVPPAVLASATNAQSALMRSIIEDWVAARGRPLMFHLSGWTRFADAAEQEAFIKAGFDGLLVHGVARPQRPNELESLFVLGTTHHVPTPAERIHLELILPYLHATWLRVQATERELLNTHDMTPMVRRHFQRAPITEREGQVLGWVREGLSNQQVAQHLGISVLTVKNHVQKILQKLGAANRTQAVAKAIALNLLVAEEVVEQRRTGT